ncbi:MAG: hypothetical protein IPI35_27145 [Deltaproteobacteria bacterium]|nr:hypothetical protein [Deltaproteobacteria bacterium]
MLTETARVGLVTGRLLPIPGFDGWTVTPVDGSSDFIVEPNGFTIPRHDLGTPGLTHGMT